MKKLLCSILCLASAFLSSPSFAQNLPKAKLIQEGPNFPNATVFYLKRITADGAAKVIKELYADLDKAAKIKVIADNRTNALMVSATDDVIKQVENLLRVLDAEQPEPRVIVKPLDEIKVFTLQNAKAAETMDVVSELVGTSVQITADARANTIIAKGKKSDLEVIEAILLRLDEVRNQSGETVAVYPLKHASVEKAEKTLSRLGLGENLAFDGDQHRLIARGDAMSHKLLRELLDTIDVPASNPAPRRMQLRIVWLVDEKLAGKDAPAPSKNLDKVVKVLEEKLGVTNLKRVAQLLVAVDPGNDGYTFTARGTTKFEDNVSVDLQAEGIVTQAGTQPTVELFIHAEQQTSGANPFPGRQSSSRLTSVTTKVAAPEGHSIVLGMAPIQSADSVFVLQVLANDDPPKASK